MGVIEHKIRNLLQEHFDLQHLQVINESYMHNVPEGAESHFKVIVVSGDFQDVPRVKRQQKVYSVLSEVLSQGVHALSQKTYTPQEWETIKPEVLRSPECQGGGKS